MGVQFFLECTPSLHSDDHNLNLNLYILKRCTRFLPVSPPQARTQSLMSHSKAKPKGCLWSKYECLIIEKQLSNYDYTEIHIRIMCTFKWQDV